MNNKTIVMAMFLMLVIVQLYVPAKMIFKREDILKTGKVYKFKTAPIDPNDPFRGKYIALNFEETSLEINGDTWEVGDKIYVSLAVDEKGFARPGQAYGDKPNDKGDYLKVQIRSVMDVNTGTISIQYPFDRFYLEESKAADAEITYRESLSDSANITYALVYIKDGEAVLSDVLINNIPIRVTIQNQKERQEIKQP